MAKKTVGLLLCAALIVSILCVFTACDQKPELKIVYLGDSIAEAVLGPSPLNERENYGYYALIGKMNNFEYVNRSVSGHRTGQMLDKLNTDTDHNALMVTSHIKSADILHISILGNDMLQDDLGALVLEQERFDRGEITELTKRNGILRSENGSRNNIDKIVKKLRELNPDAIIIFQTVYNPVHIYTSLIHRGKEGAAGARDILKEQYGYYANSDEHFQYTDTEKMNEDEAKLRVLCGKVLADLNDSVRDYVAAHEGEKLYIADATKAFGEIWDADPVRGRKLIYPDDVHPSNEGHAVMFGITQDLLTDIGVLSAKQAASALKNYKKHRIEQFKRLYPNADQKAAKKAINAGKTYDEVTNAYFRAADGLTPSYC